MSIHDFLEQLPSNVRRLPPIQAMANLIIAQATMIQKQADQILSLQKTIENLKPRDDAPPKSAQDHFTKK